MKITIKLFTSFAIMAVLLGIAGFISYRQMSDVASSFDEVQNKATPLIISLGDLKSDFTNLVNQVLAYNIHQSDVHKERMSQAESKLLSSYETYRIIEPNQVEAEAIGQKIKSILALKNEMILVNEAQQTANTSGPTSSTDHSGHMTAAGDSDTLATVAGQDIERLHVTLSKFEEQSAELKNDLDDKITANYQALHSSEQAVFEDIQAGTGATVSLTFAALAVITLTGGLTAYSIAQRVGGLKKVANRITEGNLNEEITTAGSDEIADLATNFEHMRKKLVLTQQEIAARNTRLQELNAALGLANEELKKLDALKDQFIGIASHELRAPIHPILGYAAMAKEGKIQPQVALDVIHKQAVRLKQLASDILDVSRIESGTLSYDFKKVKIHEALLNTLVAMSSNINFNHVSLATKLDEEHKDIEISVDKDRITQVFTNIIGNAIKFTKSGSITVETRLNKDTNTFEVAISDTGGGIASEIMPNLFGKFVTKNNSDSGKEGTGLGLYICKAIVNAHGGDIKAFNNDKGGATFRVILPVSENRYRMSGMVAKAVTE